MATIKEIKTTGEVASTSVICVTCNGNFVWSLPGGLDSKRAWSEAIEHAEVNPSHKILIGLVAAGLIVPEGVKT